MLRKIPNYEYRDTSKNTSDSSSGCEDDFDGDENYGINDGDDHHDLNGIDSTAATTALNLSPMPHFPPPPDYPPPSATAAAAAAATAARLQHTPQRSRYYYYENTNNKIELMNGGSRLRVGSLDRDCGYTTDGNEICCSQYNNRQNGGGGGGVGSNVLSNGGGGGSNSSHSANNSFSSTSSSSNSSVVMHKMKIPAQSQSQMRYPASNNTIQPNDFESIEIFTTEQEKRFPHKTLASLSKNGKNSSRMHHHDGIRSACSNGISNGGSTTNISQNMNVVEMLEQNLIPCGGSAASFAREAAKFHGNGTAATAAVAEPQVSFINSVLLV